MTTRDKHHISLFFLTNNAFCHLLRVRFLIFRFFSFNFRNLFLQFLNFFLLAINSFDPLVEKRLIVPKAVFESISEPQVFAVLMKMCSGQDKTRKNGNERVKKIEKKLLMSSKLGKL